MKQPCTKSGIFDIENYGPKTRPPLIPVRIQIQKSEGFKYNPSETTCSQQQYYQTVNGSNEFTSLLSVSTSGKDIDNSRLIVPQVNIKGYYVNQQHASLMAKVYGLLSLQLLLTFAVVLPMYLHKHYVEKHTPEFFWPSTVLMLVLLFVMFATHGIAKLVTSLVFLSMTGMMIGSAIVRYDVDVLLQATIITLGTTISCSIFVYFTKVNLHCWCGFLFTFLLIMTLTSLIFIFLPVSNFVHIVYCVFGIILFVGYLLYDTSELRLKEFKYEKDEYIMIATNIYLDIINLFLYILQLLSKKK